MISVLEFRSTSTAHRPVLEASGLVARYAQGTTNATVHFAAGERVPVKGVFPADLVELLHRTETRGRPRVQRGVCECGLFQMLRDSADKWRNPDADLPAD